MACTRFGRKLPVLMLVLLAILGLSAQVAAQQPTQPTQTVEQKEGVVTVKEEVTVTGTLIPREDLTSLSPVATISVEEVTYQGTGRVEDLIQQLPQAFAAQNSTISNGASGTATVQLRNLGSVRTLSLVNGRRMASGDAYETSADLNFIPAALRPQPPPPPHLHGASLAPNFGTNHAAHGHLGFFRSK